MHRPRIVMLWLCCVILNVYIVRAGYVDISVTLDNFTGFLNFTYDGYTGFFSALHPKNEQPVCKLSYIFSLGSQNVSSVTCIDLNKTDYGDFFECDAVNQTNFQCNRMGRNFVCDYGKKWVVFDSNTEYFNTKCVGICSSSRDINITILYQNPISTDSYQVCLRPAQNESTTSTEDLTLHFALSSATTTFMISQITSTSTNQSRGTALKEEESKSSYKHFIPLIAGLGTGGSILLIFFILLIVVCLKTKATKRRKAPHGTIERHSNVGDRNYVSDSKSHRTTQGNSIDNGKDLNKLSGIDLDVLDTVKNTEKETNGSNINDQRFKNYHMDLLKESLYNEIEEKKSGHDVKREVQSSDLLPGSGYLKVSGPNFDALGETATTSQSQSRDMDSDNELFGGGSKPSTNTYARLGESVREFDNPYNETVDYPYEGTDDEKSLRENTNVKTRSSHETPEKLEIPSSQMTSL